jgi:hypothetical protein
VLAVFEGVGARSREASFCGSPEMDIAGNRIRESGSLAMRLAARFFHRL